MSRRLLGVIMVCLIIVSIPALVVSLVEREPFAPPVRIKTSELTVRVLNNKTGQVMELPLDTYLVGVVSAEMPASFHQSALAAQAVAARTYAIKRVRLSVSADSSAHPQADLCTDPSHCQAWKGDDELRRDWGVLHYYSYHRRIVNAVESTSGLVATYQGELIDPVYHSTCGGATENSEDVWVYRLPYLRSVACTYCSGAPHYQEQATLSWNELYEKLNLPQSVPVVAGSGKDSKSTQANSGPAAIKVMSKSATGRVKTLSVDQRQFAGTEVRSRLGLASTRFTWQADGRGVTFRTQGYGHGVGLCQYGAQGLAQEGRSPAEILKYYYQGVEIQRMGS